MTFVIPSNARTKSVIVEIVALTDLYPRGGKVGRLGGIADQADEITGGHALQQMLEGQSPDIAAGAGDENPGHGVSFWLVDGVGKAQSRSYPRGFPAKR